MTSYVGTSLVLFDVMTERVTWSCDQLRRVGPVVRDSSSSLIYVIGNPPQQSKAAVYIISPTGMLFAAIMS